MEQRQQDGRPLRLHLEPLVRRGNADAIALFTAPDLSPAFHYLFEWYAEFCLWMPDDQAPSWRDWQAWADLMQRAVSPFELRALRRIHDARGRAMSPAEVH